MRKLKSLLLFILLPTLLFSQELPRDKQFIKDKYNINFNYGILYSGWSALIAQEWTHKHSMGLEFNYGFTKWLEAGVFFDYAPFKGMKVTSPPYQAESIDWITGDTIKWWTGGGGTWIDHNMFTYGLNANIHILPFVLDNPNFSWFDVYATTKLGMRTVYTKDFVLLDPNTSHYTKVKLFENSFYYSIGVGIGFNFSRKLGLMCEYSYSRPFRVMEEGWDHFRTGEKITYEINNTGLMMRLGLNVRF